MNLTNAANVSELTQSCLSFLLALPQEKILWLHFWVGLGKLVVGQANALLLTQNKKREASQGWYK